MHGFCHQSCSFSDIRIIPGFIDQAVKLLARPERVVVRGITVWLLSALPSHTFIFKRDFPAGRRACSKVYLTASAVNSWPLWNLTPFLK